MIEAQFPIRIAGDDDLVFLWKMLLQAVFWKTDAPQEVSRIANDSRALAYLEGWGRPGDTGLIAEEAAQPVGAAWFRLFSADELAYGFVDEDTPELVISVRHAYRGRGIGRELLRRLIAGAYADGISHLSLNVIDGNPAIRMYKEFGFAEVAELFFERDGSRRRAIIMRTSTGFSTELLEAGDR